MVGFISQDNSFPSNPPATKDNESDLSPSYVDSYLDFDFIDNLLAEEEAPCLNSAGKKVEFLEFEEVMDMVDTEREARATNGPALGFDSSSSSGLSPIGIVKEETVDESETTLCPSSALEVKVEKVEVAGLSNSNVCIEEKMEKVSLLGEEKDGKERNEEESDEEDGSSSGSESEDESSSSELSSSASSSSEDDDSEGEGKEAEQVEEGEILDSTVEKMVSWSDDEEEDEDVGVPKGPIWSKNELKDLPLVPRVDVTLQSHHQPLPVGVILSIVGAQVIVEGTEKHSPLDEGSILWISESREPLGLVDEIFGPVKNPYYIVRYNSEDEVPCDIRVSTPISYVPEFVNHVLNDGSLYKKGYDASNENDEELSDEVEFSDDEKEAEYRRMKKESKRGKNEGQGKRKKDKRNTHKQDGNWTDIHSGDQKQTQAEFGNSSLSAGRGQGFLGDPSLMQPHYQPTNPVGIMAPANGTWPMLGQQMQQNMVFPNVFHTNGMAWMQSNHQQQQYQMSLPQGMPFQQQFEPNQMLLQNVGMPGGQPNFVPGSANQPWMGFMAQNGGFIALGLGLQGQQLQQFMPMQGVSTTHAPGVEQNSGMQSQSSNIGNKNTPQFCQGNSSGRGSRTPYNRGRRGRFAGGRGRHQRN